MNKIILLIVLILFTNNIYCQITDVTILPYQNQSNEYFESTPVAISNDELLVFYATNNNTGLYTEIDTIYSIHSFNSGKTWQKPEFIFEIKKSRSSDLDPHYISSFKTSNGRILLCWVDRYVSKIALMHSDDNGYSWSDTIRVKGGGNNIPLQRASLYDLNLSEINDGKLILSFNRKTGSEVYYRESTDNGETWSQNPSIFYSGTTDKIRNLSFVSLPAKLLAFFEFTSNTTTQNSGIYYRVSTNSGLSWSANNLVIDLPGKEKNPRVVKYSDSKLELIYQVEDTTQKYDSQNDIYTIQSSNGGVNWTPPERFTKYAGEDRFVQAAKLGDKVFVTFSTTRFTNKDQISYAILGETTETYKPPYIRTVLAIQDSIDTKKWFVSCKITDDEQIVFANVEFEDGSTTELYDDGKHSDGDSADYIYANALSFKYYSPSTTGIINVNKLQLPFDNSGILADVVVFLRNNSIFRATDNSSYSSELITPSEVASSSSAKYDDITFLFSGGFGLSGYTNGELWANAQASASRIVNYIPGRVGDNPENSTNTIYTVYGYDLPFGYSWQRWKDAVSLGANFYDGDGDGIYNPVDKNWNGILDLNEDMPDLLGDFTAWCVYNDGVPASMRERFAGIGPQGIEVEQTLFASSKPELENIIFIRYKLTNKGTVAEVLDSVIFSFWADQDLGDYTDDLAGCDTLINSGFCYNNGEDDEYGVNPPAFFTTLLQGPQSYTNDVGDIAYDRKGLLLGADGLSGYKNLDISAFNNYFNLLDPIQNFDDEFNFRFRMKGLTNNGEKLDPCTFLGGEVRGVVDCSKVNPFYWYSGDPVGDIGWINILPTDQRTMLSVGEFTLEKNKPVTIIGAYVVGRGTDALNSITVARENVQRAIQEYQSNFASLTYNPGEPTNPVTSYILYQNYPNPFNPITTIRYELPQDGVVTIELFDILGQKVKTILNELKKADRYEVKFNSTGLASGVYFYRLQAGSFFETKKMILLK